MDPTKPSRGAYEDRCNSLAGRLEDGWRRIDEAQKLGADIRKWEDFWFQLLDDYTAACDELASLTEDW